MLTNLFKHLKLTPINRCWYSGKMDQTLPNAVANMPKAPRRSRMAQNQQNNKNMVPPGTIYIQVIGTGAPGASSSIYIFSDQTRYLINCGEGTQRLAHEHRTRLTRLNHIFMTRTSWKHIGGLPGLSLTIQDAGATRLTLHGPPKLQETFSAMRRFVILNKLQLNYCEQGEVFEDSVLTMNSVPLQRKEESGDQLNGVAPSTPNIRIIEDYHTDYYAHECGTANATEANPAIVQHRLEKSDESVVMAYICKFKAKLGALNLDKCIKKGVPVGPLLGQLKKGEDIVLPNGDTVLAADVRDPDDPGPVILIVDVPTRAFLESLLESTAFEEYQQDDQENCLNLILHFTPNDIATSDEYKGFMSKFPTQTKHWFINESNKSSGFVAAHRLQWQMNLLNEHTFPILGEAIEQPLNTDTDIAIKRPKLDESVVIKGDVESMAIDEIRPLTTYHFRPTAGLDRSDESLVQPEVYINELNELKEFTESLCELKEAQQRLARPSHCSRDEEYPKFVFLGTGSCVPNKTRNVSAILVHVTNERSILLDSGEGTVGQIHRFYGPRADDVFRRIKCIAITHLHADHHLGLIGVLQARRRVLGDESDPIILLAPDPIRGWLDSYDHRVEPISPEYRLFSNSQLTTETLLSEELLDLGIKSIRTCLVKHCAEAYAFSFIVDSDKTNQDEAIKITYSGDTMPCQSLIDLGYDSTVLIHEATLEDALVDEAKKKAHSTVSQALEQGRKMNAKFVLLTHFSQRYAKIPRVEQNLENVGIAMDNMEVVLSDLDRLGMMYPTMKKMFPDAWNDMEQRILSREKRKENGL